MSMKDRIQRSKERLKQNPRRAVFLLAACYPVFIGLLFAVSFLLPSGMWFLSPLTLLQFVLQLVHADKIYYSLYGMAHAIETWPIIVFAPPLQYFWRLPFGQERPLMQHSILWSVGYIIYCYCLSLFGMGLMLAVAFSGVRM